MRENFEKEKTELLESKTDIEYKDTTQSTKLHYIPKYKHKGKSHSSTLTNKENFRPSATCTMSGTGKSSFFKRESDLGVELVKSHKIMERKPQNRDSYLQQFSNILLVKNSQPKQIVTEILPTSGDENSRLKSQLS